MRRLKVLIVEDQWQEREHLTDLLTSLGYDVAGSSDNIEEAYQLYQTNQPHICLLDIFLNGKPDGIALAERIEHGNQNVRLIFLTGHHDTSTFLLAKLVNPYGYLLKPYNPLELQYAIELAAGKTADKAMRETDPLFVKRGNQIIRLRLEDIRYIEVSGKYSKIVCQAEHFLIQQSLKDIQQQLPGSLFSRIHRNYIVNIKDVVRINTTTNEVLFKDGTSLCFSRRYLDGLLGYFKIFK